MVFVSGLRNYLLFYLDSVKAKGDLRCRGESRVGLVEVCDINHVHGEDIKRYECIFK